MTMRRKILLALVGVLIVAGVLYWAFRPEPEPTYNGKTLSEWLAVLDPGTYPQGLEPAIAKAQSEEAIHRIGTNAIPYLLNWIKYRPLYGRPKLSRSEVDRAKVRAGAACYAFQILGKDARGAIPELKRQAIDQKPSNQLAMTALAYLGQDGLPLIMEALTNQAPNTRLTALYALEQMGTNAQTAIPLVINLLNDTNFPIPGVSARCLGSLKLDPDSVIPALTNSLLITSNNEHAIIGALGEYRAKALPAVPLLLKYLNANSYWLRSNATNALLKIDPEALKRATQK